MVPARRTLCAALIATSVGFTAPQINGPAIASTRASAPASGWTDDPSPGLAGQLRAAMRATVQAGATSMIARVDQGRHVVALGVGLARLEPMRAVRANDAVRIGSITKSMLATVALQVAAEGKLHLSDTIEDWLPGLVPDGDRITLRMLLNHTSGIVDYADDTFVDAIIADPYTDKTVSVQPALAQHERNLNKALHGAGRRTERLDETSPELLHRPQHRQQRRRRASLLLLGAVDARRRDEPCLVPGFFAHKRPRTFRSC
jgi:CubicO group peptidase (beta-lactamase class C family)